MGKEAGSLFVGTDIFFDKTVSLKSEAQSLLVENREEYVLKDSMFVFSMHQGYEFLFFDVNEGDNPSVYQYIEDNGSPKKTWSRFSGFLEDALNAHISLLGK